MRTQPEYIFSHIETTATGHLVTHIHPHLIYVGDRVQQYFLSGPRDEIIQDSHRVGLFYTEKGYIYVNDKSSLLKLITRCRDVDLV